MNDIAIIDLGKGYETILDSEDAVRFEGVPIRCHFGRNEVPRAIIRLGAENGHKRIYLSRLLVFVRDDQVVDHINGDTLDNRRANLRVCSIQENGRNKRRPAIEVTSQFKGVDIVPSKVNKYRAQIAEGGTKHYLGCFPTEIEAARAYNIKALEIHGAFAAINFLPD